MIEPYIKQSHKIRADERESAFWSAALLLGACVLASLLFWIVFGLFEIPIEYTKICVVLLVAYYGWKAGVVIIYGWWRGEVRADRVFVLGQNLVKAHQRHVYPEPTPLPTPTLPLPAPVETFALNPNRAGTDEPKELWRGFDPRDVEFLARQMAHGFPFTEKGMEFLVLPYSKVAMGKAEIGTLYTEFLAWCVEAKVITGREGKKAGTLAIVTAPAIVDALRGVK